MSCPKLAQYQACSFEALRSFYLAFAGGMEQFRDDVNTILETHPNFLQEKLGEACYYHLGYYHARCRQWNEMTLIQLEHVARIEGLLGPYEPNRFSEWQLRLRLGSEARKADQAAGIEILEVEAEEEEKKEEEDDDEKVILTRKHGITMVF
jgi:hypothetical protein